ncbi:extracellular solute-binding protein [Saliphagus sp. GCM10025334]
MADRSGVNRRQFIRAAGTTGIGASIAGCLGGSSSGEGSGDRTIEMTLLSQMTEDQIDGFEPALRAGGLSEDISIEIDTATPGQLEDQYRQWLNAGRGSPDVLTMDVGWSIPFIRRGQLLNLNEHLDDSEIDTLESEFNDASLDSSRGQEGNLYGVPFMFDVRGLLYRRDLAEQAGYDPDAENWGSEPRSWQEVSEIIADVQEQQDLDYGLTMPFELSQTITCCTFNAMMSQWGGAYFGGRDNLFGPIGDRPITVDEEPVLNALRMLRTFFHGHDDEHSLDEEFAGEITPTEALGWRYTSDMESFLNGNAFAYTEGQVGFVTLGATDDYFGEAVNEKLGLMPYPYGVEQSETEYDGIGGPMSPLAGYNLSVNPNSNKTDAALEVIRAAMTDEFHLEWFNVGGNPPPKESLQDSEEVMGHETYGPYMDAMSVAADHAVPRPVTPIYFQQSDIVAQEVHNVVSQDKSPEQGMADLKDQLQQIEEDNAQ